MEEWKKDARRDVVFVDIDALVPQNHLLRKIEKVMDYDWLYERLDPYEYDPKESELTAAKPGVVSSAPSRPSVEQMKKGKSS